MIIRVLLAFFALVLATAATCEPAPAPAPVPRSYLDFLKTQASISKSTGVGRGHTHADQPAARGVIDYWEAESGEDWAVKGWVDNSRREYPYLSAQQVYLDGFRFK